MNIYTNLSRLIVTLKNNRDIVAARILIENPEYSPSILYICDILASIKEDPLYAKNIESSKLHREIQELDFTLNHLNSRKNDYLGYFRHTRSHNPEGLYLSVISYLSN